MRKIPSIERDFFRYLGNIFVLMSGIIEPKNLLPLFPRIQTYFNNRLSQYFHHSIWQMVCFTTILPYLNKPQLGKKTGVISLILIGLLLSGTHALQISVLGAVMYSRATFPMFVTISKVNIADFLQSMDSIVILTLIIGVYFKISIYCFAAVNAFLLINFLKMR
ncbi:spore germination protein [Bacillus sp. X1(2014)]|uniref:spore germination protein n=1 Tax=Bacillus sp. X1(2014) TaxID=1565991 RepID=UPI0021B4815F|nr:spore germination protein [Bacillus sp. X1(2014)]